MQEGQMDTSSHMLACTETLSLHTVFATGVVQHIAHGASRSWVQGQVAPDTKYPPIFWHSAPTFELKLVLC